LIDLDTPPEYAPPVPPHSPTEITFPEFIYEMPTPEIVLPQDAKPTYQPYRPDQTTYQPYRPPQKVVLVEESRDEVEDEDEDPEVAFYREMRQQEEERRQRMN